MPAQFDIIVIGAGHAGIEAAAAAARLGCRTAMVSGNLDTIGKMSCNPSIGGVAKGQLAREVDALGGLMGLATDATGIQFRTLGLSKGPALWSPRAQCDKAAYAAWMKERIEATPNLFPIQGEAVDILTSCVLGSQFSVDSRPRMPSDPERRTQNAGRSVSGIRLRDGRTLEAPRVVLTTGTFLQGLMHQGETRTGGGRMGDQPAMGLSDSLRGLGLRLIRHKTGTPCRIHGDSIRWDLCEEQPGDEPPKPFSFLTARITQPQMSCWICHTTKESHAPILANLHRSPMYNGQISSVGPRYCPSIEDKVVRFKDRDSHHLFLEPEGRATKEIYVNGLSTSMPIDVQDAVLALIPALANAHVLRYGYAVEYDVVAPEQMTHALEARTVPGLFLAGQINGTSGYEEAAAQGIVAGANAALTLAGAAPLAISRADAYIGVLIDDLVTRCPEEPYRMFTSRAEHRLHLRSDNADRRLTPLAARAGLVPKERAALVAAKESAVATLVATVPDELQRKIAGEGMAFAEASVLLPALATADALVAEQAWIELRYSTYLERQQTRIDQLQRFRDLELPADLDLAAIACISHEGRQRLAAAKPRTLGEANSLPGVSQADLETLYAVMQGRGRRSASA
ncbi:MAG: tRNA uridine-5-carboxymethylaminomethyl(34) synthesis enzyme MnmG [Planctomycetes bacterium]|nr:tRNA uridine-5-carboxymethylaminomethyl(34) synthesis enzyme MnmG [Planctomycetota bacterium]